MKAFQIEDAKTRFFTSKENYLNFKQAWKDFHNAGLHVSRGEWTTPSGKVKEYRNPLLTSGHYMLYNLLRGYDIARGYSEHSENGWAACDYAAGEIIRTARNIKDINTSGFNQRFARGSIKKLLLPFGGTITNQMLYDLAADLYKGIAGQEFPAFVVEEAKETEAPKPAEKKTERKLFSWS